MTQSLSPAVRNKPFKVLPMTNDQWPMANDNYPYLQQEFLFYPRNPQLATSSLRPLPMTNDY
jgi:hypothetical protein